MAASDMAEFRNPYLAQLSLNRGDVLGSELNPGAVKSVLVIHDGFYRFGRSELGELDAERTPIAKRNEEDGVGQAEIQLLDVATENIPEEVRELGTSPWTHEDVDPGAEPDDPRLIQSASHGESLTNSTSRGFRSSLKTWLCFAERIGYAAAEAKQDGPGHHSRKRAAPPDGVWRRLQQEATNRRAQGQ